MKIGVMGATGYAGAELLRLASVHPDLDVVVATGASSVGLSVAASVPGLAASYPELVVDAPERSFDHDLGAVFLCLPHGESQSYVPELRRRGVQVIDLGADFRLKNALDYPTWYGHEHGASELLASSVYGLVERHRRHPVGAELTAVPGCCPSASVLSL